MAKTKVGVVTHYFDKIGVAVLKVTQGTVRVGDTIQIGEDEQGFSQVVDSMQVDHASVSTAKKGDEVGLKVSQPAKHHENVYKA
ncbi:hypothetical protein M1116_03315 [Patescibacteria group bacterium]|nr:hypothetical protein [Patescibacteria group bacterium]